MSPLMRLSPKGSESRDLGTWVRMVSLSWSFLSALLSDWESRMIYRTGREEGRRQVGMNSDWRDELKGTVRKGEGGWSLRH
jgi:hypothetical protein